MALVPHSDFLEQCSQSSQAAYEALKGLLEFTQTTDGLILVRKYLGELIKISSEMNETEEEFIRKYHFGFSTLALWNEAEDTKHLNLLQLPSIFTPEDWSFTFFEGLARYPSSEFQGRITTELGCGNGWISIALAAKTKPAKMIGLDINPRAITCARLNLLLNALDHSGTPIIDSEGKSLLDRVEFHVSDLLGYPIEKKIQVDRIIGCIPQVLSPEPLAAAQFVSEDSDDNFLYSLSNYCEKQGYVEDQFGLGLIARALEEAIIIAKPSAKVVLNMGGRPGTAVLERLFLRRGFQIRKLWSTKVWQAGDTDILPLVEIERLTPHRFEFFSSLTSDEPISARTAQHYLKAGGKIAHSLSVYEAQIKNHGSIKSLFKFIKQDGFEDSRTGIDLAFSDDELAEEKTEFIGSLSEWLSQHKCLPYSDAEGEPQLRRQIAQFFRSYWKIPVTAKSIFIAPNRKSLLKNQIQMMAPKLALVEKELSHFLPQAWLQTEWSTHHTTVIEAPRRVDEICKLVEALKPQLVVTALKDFESRTSDAFVRLCSACEAHNAQLILDLSEQFELSSQPAPNGVLSYLSENPLPANVTIVCGLVKNKVYSDLEICFLLSENRSLLEKLRAAAELTYSRTPLLTQRYYGRIFSDLLNFQLSDVRQGRSEQLRLPAENPDSPVALPQAHVVRAFSHPAIAIHSQTVSSQTVRLDYGENCFNSPPLVYSAIMESFLRQNISQQELNCERPIVELIRERFGVHSLTETDVTLGLGVAPLFTAALEVIKENCQSVLLPTGAYGYFKAACDYIDVPHSTITTSERHDFKVTATELDAALSASPSRWLYINGPVVNPTGAVYSNGELIDIIEVLRSHKCNLIMDTVFSGLEFNKKQMSIHLERNIDPAGGSECDVTILLLGGLSKELAAGGLRFGWAATSDKSLTTGLRGKLSAAPHSTVRYAAKKIYSALNESGNALHTHLDSQRQSLISRSKTLSSLLVSLGWEVVEPEGGLFVCALPRKYIGTGIKSMDSETLTSAADAVAESLFTTTGLLINGSTWTGLPGYLRFVVSVSENEFASAVKKLQEFDSCWHMEQH
ncbi:MAG: hypothetical protein RJB13_2080 [Pseudomonadota bacterium]